MNNNDVHQKYHTLPKKNYSKRSKASVCRELLNQIKTLMFLLHDVTALEKLKEDLSDLLEDLRQEVPFEDEMINESASNV